LSFRGAAFGLEPVLTQSAWFRPHNRSEDVDRLYLVGAGTHPGAGLPGVLSSARILDSLVPDAQSLPPLEVGDRMTTRIDPSDMAACRTLLKGGSRTFHAASLVLPRRVADPAIALYAFCRLADDAVDLGGHRAAAVERLKQRLDLAIAASR